MSEHEIVKLCSRTLQARAAYLDAKWDSSRYERLEKLRARFEKLDVDLVAALQAWRKKKP